MRLSNTRHTAAGSAERFNGLSPVGQFVALVNFTTGHRIDLVGVCTAEKKPGRQAARETRAVRRPEPVSVRVETLRAWFASAEGEDALWI